MGRVKSAFEKAMERAAGFAELTADEKEMMKARETMRELLAVFYRGEADRGGVWAKLRGLGEALLQEAQAQIIGSLSLLNTPEEFLLRRQGIMQIEALKTNPRASTVEDLLDAVGDIQQAYVGEKEQIIDELRKAVESNPQMRARPVRTADGRTVMKATLSVEEALQARLPEFLDEHDRRFTEMFLQVVERLKGQAG